MNSLKLITLPSTLVVAGSMVLGAGGCRRDDDYRAAPPSSAAAPVPAAAPETVTQTEYLAEQPIPPAVPVEVVPVSPGPEYVWIGGSYDWVGFPGRWQWVPGRWERPARPHAMWHEGEWHRDGHGYHWEHGHWR